MQADYEMPTLSNEELYERLDAIRQSLTEESILPRDVEVGTLEYEVCIPDSEHRESAPSCPGCGKNMIWIIPVLTSLDAEAQRRGLRLRPCCSCGSPLPWPAPDRI
jgi:hypothetical protein